MEARCGRGAGRGISRSSVSSNSPPESVTASVSSCARQKHNAFALGESSVGSVNPVYKDDIERTDAKTEGKGYDDEDGEHDSSRTITTAGFEGKNASEGNSNHRSIKSPKSVNSKDYCAREKEPPIEEDSRRLKFLCCANDGINEHMIWLIGLKNNYSWKLPKTPKVYIVRLLMDGQRFGEIVFFAVMFDGQRKGYGTRMMHHLKQHARDVDGMTHFLTYASNNDAAYFVDQGFTKEITLDNEKWQGYLKEYEGSVLMECKIDPKLSYFDMSTINPQQSR